MAQGGQTGGNAYAQAANAMMGAGGATQNAISQFGNVPTVASGMSLYQNPYEQQVIDRSMADIGRTTAMQQEANKASAAGMGAFGGSRQGLVEAETNAAAQRTMGDLSANLRSQGFNTAANLSGQDINNRFTGASGLLSGAGTLGNLGTTAFNMGNTLETNQYNRGMDQQRMEQQRLNDARQLFMDYTNSPANMLQMLSSSLSGSPLNNNTTTSGTYKPGVMDFLSLFTGLKGL